MLTLCLRHIDGTRMFREVNPSVFSDNINEYSEVLVLNMTEKKGYDSFSESVSVAGVSFDDFLNVTVLNNTIPVSSTSSPSSSLKGLLESVSPTTNISLSSVKRRIDMERYIVEGSKEFLSREVPTPTISPTPTIPPTPPVSPTPTISPTPTVSPTLTLNPDPQLNPRSKSDLRKSQSLPVTSSLRLKAIKSKHTMIWRPFSNRRKVISYYNWGDSISST